LARAFIGLGANAGDRETNIRRALALIGETGAGRLVRVSGLIETEPVGGPAGQRPYLNGAVEIETDLQPQDLLTALKDIEKRVGRVERQRWGPREVDLDILLYDDLVLDSAALRIPHPRMLERRFVLGPLAEIAKGVIHPISGRTIGQHAAEVEGRGEAC